jgi:hypothetical protein
MAKRHGNPTMDPTLPYGHLPTGTYRGVISVPRHPERSYGSDPVIVLNPLRGQCAVAKANGRFGLLIHGGETRGDELRPTYGCLRLSDVAMGMLVDAWSEYDVYSVTVEEVG